MKISQQNKSFFMGNPLFGNQEADIREKVAKKKALYWKEGMRIVTDANNGEKKIDKNIEDIQERVRRMQAENDEANVYLQDLNKKMAEAKESYNIEDGSQEEQDLELLKKKYDIDTHGSTTLLTDEEKKRLEEMGEMTEYQKLSMELYAQADRWKTQISDNLEKMALDGRSVRLIKVDRLKSHALIDAQKARDEIMEAASKEAMGMLVDDAKEKIDEKAEELQEAAEKREEKEEEQEERIEAAKENREETEAAVEAARENIKDLTENVMKGEDIVRDIDSEIKKILEEEKLLLEDLKGLNVNATV